MVWRAVESQKAAFREINMSTAITPTHDHIIYHGVYDARDHHDDHHGPGSWTRIFLLTTNHKDIGSMYL
jgi:hypothetical protein